MPSPDYSRRKELDMTKYEGFIGKVLDNRYKILELVGLGGMACVLKAQDLVMNRIVAIKILNDEYNGNEAAEARFIDESKAVAMLSNKNIVNVYDVAIYPDIKYIVMEYLDGITLREYLDNKGAIGWKEACIYTLQILRALEHAHSKGIIHRDIKPQNVILMRNGDIKVTDFGIAKLPNSENEEQDEKAVGTVYYISPEQACGKETDCHSDIYSVGILLYEAVTGTLPFTAETPMEVAMLQVNEDPVHPRDIVLDIPVGVSQIILKAMEKAPENRFASAHTMTKAIEWVLRNPDVIFAMSESAADEAPTGTDKVVSIDMIVTAEIEPYADDEIKNSLSDNSKTIEKIKKKNDEPIVIKRKRKKTSTSMFPIISGVTVAFLIVAAMIGVMMISKWIENTEKKEATAIQDIALPNIVGAEFSLEFQEQLAKGSLKEYNNVKVVIKEIIEVNDKNYAHNEIIECDPDPSNPDKPIFDKPDNEGTIYFERVWVNKLESSKLLDITGMYVVNAENKLKDLGFEYVKKPLTEINDGDNIFYNRNQVVKFEVETAPGEEYDPEDPEKFYTIKTTLVRIYYYDDVAEFPLPDVIGMTEEDAKLRLEYAGYLVKTEYTNKSNGDNKVHNQTKDGKTVTITVWKPFPKIPDLTGLTYERLNTVFEKEEFIDCDIKITPAYFVASEDSKAWIEALSKSCDDYDSLMRMFEDQNIVRYDEHVHPECVFTVVFQDVRIGTNALKVDEINVVLIGYIPYVEQPDIDDPANGDDNSSDDNSSGDNSENSGSDSPDNGNGDGEFSENENA